jgi:hypothetical protein
MANHADLTGAELHEPKGVSGATVDTVYKADGAGSGAWAKVASDEVTSADAGGYYTGTNVEAILQELRSQDPTGWCQYNDSVYTGATELDVTATAPGTQITCNKSTSIETQAPRDMASGTLWDSTSNTFTPINENDYYIVRVTFTASTVSGTINFVTLDLDIGGTPGIIWSETFIPDKGAGQYFSFAIPVYTGNTFVPNGGTFYLTKNGGGTFKIQDIGFSISRIHRGR